MSNSTCWRVARAEGDVLLHVLWKLASLASGFRSRELDLHVLFLFRSSFLQQALSLGISPQARAGVSMLAWRIASFWLKCPQTDWSPRTRPSSSSLDTKTQVRGGEILPRSTQEAPIRSPKIGKRPHDCLRIRLAVVFETRRPTSFDKPKLWSRTR